MYTKILAIYDEKQFSTVTVDRTPVFAIDAIEWKNIWGAEFSDLVETVRIRYGGTVYAAGK